MLREIYTLLGGVGTFFAGIGMFVSVIAWWMAVTGIVVRDMQTVTKGVLLLVIFVLPPLAVIVFVSFLVRDQSREKASQMMPVRVRSTDIRPDLVRVLARKAETAA